MEVIHERCAGLDIGKGEVVACVQAPHGSGRRRQEVGTFSTFSRSLEALAEWLGEVLIECARAAARSRNPYFLAQYWRLSRKIGKKKAAGAVGHSILVVAWHLLTYDCDYEDLGGDYFVQRDTDRTRQRAKSQLQALGYRVILSPLHDRRG